MYDFTWQFKNHLFSVTQQVEAPILELAAAVFYYGFIQRNTLKTPDFNTRNQII
jgi:hypothetical protein